jgi:hypothetical protein
MRIPSSSIPICLAACVVALVLIGAPRASAQVLVTLEMNKKVYVAYEPILATVTVSNRAGRDIILGDHHGQSWLSFQVSSIGGETILPYRGAPRVEPKVLSAGKSVREAITLGSYYPLGGQDNYSIRAAVYFNETGQHFGSNVCAARISEGQRFWEDQVGIPRSNGRSDYRRFSLLSFQENDRMSVFVRVRDQNSQRVLATYSLGRLVPHRDPQATLDGQNRLHVLFLTGPRFFRHCVIDPDGEKVSEEVFEGKEGSLPTLMLANTGNVRVEGGQLFDPNVPAAQPRDVVHRFTDRPPGVPAE